MSKTIYISGPMTGLPNKNLEAFTSARETLRGRGFTVLCPGEEHAKDPDLPRAAAMRRDITSLLQVDEVWLLDGWENSRGSNLEVAVAKEIGIPIRLCSTEELLDA